MSQNTGIERSWDGTPEAQASFASHPLFFGGIGQGLEFLTCCFVVMCMVLPLATWPVVRQCLSVCRWSISGNSCLVWRFLLAGLWCLVFCSAVVASFFWLHVIVLTHICFCWPRQFVLPSNPLQAIFDQITHTTLEESSHLSSRMKQNKHKELTTPKLQPSENTKLGWQHTMWLCLRWALPPVKAQTQVRPIDRLTKRITAASHFRAHFDTTTTTPNKTLADLAKRVPRLKVSQISGGQWWSEKLKGKEFLHRTVKIPTNIANTIIRYSSTWGIFTCKLAFSVSGAMQTNRGPEWSGLSTPEHHSLSLSVVHITLGILRAHT